MKYNYGECEICDGRLVEKQIKQDFWIRGKLVVIDNVPAGVCLQCGAKVVRSEIGKRIAATLGKPKEMVERVDDPRSGGRASSLASPIGDRF